MWALFSKEISGFFSSLTGYVVIVVFLLLNSLFMWIVPGQFNVMENGYATLDTLFAIAPWVFLFLVPAITMRMISEEKRAGTLDLLYTRPVSELQILLAKFFCFLGTGPVFPDPHTGLFLVRFQAGKSPWKY